MGKLDPLMRANFSHLSGLHLNVLQNLVTSGNFPVALLRVTGPAIANLLLPSTGLGPVLQSSNFDLVSVQAKLDELNALPNRASATLDGE